TTHDVVSEASSDHNSFDVTNQHGEGSTQSSSEFSADGNRQEVMEIPAEIDLDQDPDEDNETPEEWKERVANFFRQMMFVSGETAEPSAETTTLIEEIVRQQVIEMVSTIII